MHWFSEDGYMRYIVYIYIYVMIICIYIVNIYIHGLKVTLDTLGTFGHDWNAWNWKIWKPSVCTILSILQNVYKWIQWNKSSVGDGRHVFTVVVLANLRIDDFEVPPVRQKIEIERAWSLTICRPKWRTVATVGHRLAHLKHRMQLQVQMFYSSAFWMEVCCAEISAEWIWLMSLEH